MLQKDQCTLYSGGLKGAECAFGEAAEKWGMKEVNFTFAGRTPDRRKHLVVLSDDELRRGDISMELAAKMMNRTYYKADNIRKVLQTIFHMVNKGHQVFAVGVILEDNTVKGGTGWAVELAKLFNLPVSVYDQKKDNWFTWTHGEWQQDTPKIEHQTIVGSGTRELTDKGRAAIDKLFADAFAD